MNGKLLVLCDELPGAYDGYVVKDCRYFKIPYIDPAEDSDIVYMCWDSIIPEDRAFIEACKYYATFRENPKPTFILEQRGATDPATGTLKTSIQEETYYNLYLSMVQRLRIAQSQGEDIYGEAMDMSIQYPFQASFCFFADLTNLFNAKNVIRILPTYSKTSEPNITNYRAALLKAWQDQNRFFEKKSPAQILPTIEYANFAEVQSQAMDEILEIYSLPIWGNEPSSRH